MIDFSQLGKRAAGEATRPPTMPGGDYPCIARTNELGESQQKKTPFVRYYLTLLDWPSTIQERWTEHDEKGKVWEYSKADIDLSKKPQRFEFYFPKEENGEFNQDALWRFDEFLRSCGIDPSGRSYEELFPVPVGSRMLLTMRQQMNMDTGRTFTRPDKLVGMP